MMKQSKPRWKVVNKSTRNSIIINKRSPFCLTYLPDTIVHNHLDRTSVFSQGQIKILIVRTKVIGRDPMRVFTVPPHPDEEQRLKDCKENNDG
jgi:hypothetical protein